LPIEEEEQISCSIALMQTRGTCGDFHAGIIEGPFVGREFLQKLVEMDLRELCRLTQTRFECFKDALSPCANINNSMMGHVRQQIHLAEMALNYVCVKEIEVFNRNKACLLRETNTESTRSTPELMLGEALEKSCFPLVDQRPAVTENPLCIPDELHSCAKDVVSAQCGDEVAGALSEFADQVFATVGCSTPSARSITHAQQQRRGAHLHKTARKSKSHP